MNWRIILGVVLLSGTPAAAQTTPCLNPPGDEGDQVYNTTYHVMQYCNGSHWVAMGSIMGQGDGLGDHMAGQALDMGGFRIQNLAPPTADNHAVTRAYVTSAIAAIPAPTTPNLSAVLATGNAAGNRKITGLATPTASTDAATMAYADTKVRKAGDTMTGALNIPVTPTANAHATSKEYVDTVVASASGGGAVATCQVICNGTCPTAPSGWTLSQSTGASGGWVPGSMQLSGFAAGRCLTRTSSPYGTPDLAQGVERMCCYFKS